MSELPHDLARTSITKLGALLDTSEDNSAVLLVANNWDERKILNAWKHSKEEMEKDFGLVPDTGLEYLLGLKEGPCGICRTPKHCQMFGCLHSICPTCFQGYAHSKVVDGELNIKCPVPTCEKMASPSLFLEHLSLEANVIYSESLTNDFISGKNKVDKNALIHVEHVLATVYRLWRNLKGFGTKLWQNKKSVIISFLAVISFCHAFCIGDTNRCATELLVVNWVAILLDVWRNLLKTMLVCLIYKLYQMPSYTLWTVGVLSCACTGGIIFCLGGRWIRKAISCVRSVRQLF